ncbi:MAG: signal peptidase I [Clostridia bacterium]|nr:signal peptidase I [Clostridia bacterium]
MNVVFRKRYKENTLLQRAAKMAADTVLVICVAYMLMSLICTRAHIIGNSMNSLLQNGQTVLINKLPYAFSSPKRFDIIAFEAAGVNSSRVYVKRVIGLPGETVQIKDGKVFINGKQLENDVVTDDILTPGLVSDPVILGFDEYFVLGDNRNNSEDSRFSNIAMVKEENIIGSVWAIISPIRAFKFI